LSWTGKQLIEQKIWQKGGNKKGAKTSRQNPDLLNDSAFFLEIRPLLEDLWLKGN
jgi:hypothetical protein